MTLTELFTNIANAIRSKKGTSDKINATDFATEIENIQTGGGDISEYFTETISAGDSSIVPGYAKTIKKLPLYKVEGTDTKNMFSNLLITEIPQLDTSNVTKMEYMFNSCKNLITIPLLNTKNVVTISNMFYGCTSLTIIPRLDTSNVTEFVSTFYNCTSLTEIPLLDTSKAINMSSMFYQCKKLKSIPLLNTANVVDMSSMFYYCSALTEIPLLDTSKVTKMNGMFQYCNALTTIPRLDTSNVTAANSMFYQCQYLESIPLLDFNKVVNINYMLISTANLTNLGGFLNLGKGYTSKQNNNSTYKLTLNNSNKLTHDSLMNVINNLYDLNLTYDVANGGTLYTQQLQLGSKNLAKLTAEEIAIATNKRMVC